MLFLLKEEDEVAIKVALDAGHGCDTWEVKHGKGVRYGDGCVFEEHTFNAAVVGYTKELLECNGIEVILTQPLNQKEVGLKARTDLANKLGVTILVSFHADANGDPKNKGHWVFHWFNSAKSKQLAQIWDKYANQIMDNPCRGIQESKPNHWTDFHMVRETNMPAILIEHAFMTNAEDLNRLLSEDFRRKCAEVAARTICEYCGVAYKEKIAEPQVVVKPPVVAPTEAPKTVDPIKLGQSELVEKQIRYLSSLIENEDKAATWASNILADVHDYMKSKKYL